GTDTVHGIRGQHDHAARPDRIRRRTQPRASAPSIPAVEYRAHASTPPRCAPRMRPQTTMLALSSYSELMPQLLRAALTVYRSHVERIDPLCGHESWSSGEILVFDDLPQNAPSRKQPRHRTRMRVVVLHRDSTARVQQSPRRRHHTTNHRKP